MTKTTSKLTKPIDYLVEEHSDRVIVRSRHLQAQVIITDEGMVVDIYPNLTNPDLLSEPLMSMWEFDDAGMPEEKDA